MSYTTGPLKVTGGYRYRNSEFNTDATLLRDDYWFAGVNYQATAALGLQLGYYYSNIKQYRPAPGAASTNPDNPQQVSFVADYSLSKRTDIYLSTAYAKNAGLNFDTSAISFANGYFPGAGKSSMVGAALGVRHKF
ncbi:hypothetical protein D9M71_713850 [compost metagenome]